MSSKCVGTKGDLTNRAIKGGRRKLGHYREKYRAAVLCDARIQCVVEHTHFTFSQLFMLLGRSLSFLSSHCCQDSLNQLLSQQKWHSFQLCLLLIWAMVVYRGWIRQDRVVTHHLALHGLILRMLIISWTVHFLLYFYWPFTSRSQTVFQHWVSTLSFELKLPLPCANKDLANDIHYDRHSQLHPCRSLFQLFLWWPLSMNISRSSMNGEEVLGALTLACSQDPSLLKVGEGQLEAWKREKGFYTTLAVSSNQLTSG